MEEDRRKKAVIEVLQVLAANRLTASEIQVVLMDVNNAINYRPLTMEYIEEFSKNPLKFTACF